MGFKENFSFDNRFLEASLKRKQYPHRIPVICEKGDKKIRELKKKKYLVPDNLTLGQFIYILRKRIRLEPHEAMFLFINKKIFTCSTLIGLIYDQEKSADGFLYIYYATENTFG
jgi:GABA(A) receptor-associated protein